VWNSLADEFISAPSLNVFKDRLDKFWAQQEFFYNDKANVTAIKVLCHDTI